MMKTTISIICTAALFGGLNVFAFSGPFNVALHAAWIAGQIVTGGGMERAFDFLGM